MRNVLMQINICDSFFKAQQRVNELSDMIAQKDHELFDLRHEIIGYKTQVEELQRKNEALKDSSLEEQKKIIKLEAELESASKSSRRK